MMKCCSIRYPEFWLGRNDEIDDSGEDDNVSYDVVNILANIVSEDPQTWTLQSPDRDSVLDKIATTINTWDICNDQGYNSFSPWQRKHQSDDIVLENV